MNEKRYTHIIHLSDIHIRRGNTETSRIDEYSFVFSELSKQLYDNPLIQQQKCLIVVTGDIFHDKGIIEPQGIRLFYEFLEATTSHAPTIIIAGNHDVKLDDDTNKPDILNVLISKYKSTKYPLYYLNKTQSYKFDNIGIGLTTIQDILWSPTLPNFPKPGADVEFNVGLCHVSIHEALPPNIPKKSPITLKYFDEYDFVLLGDIHARQIHDDDHLNLKWGYAGSLIQQNFGESVDGHGYIVWDLVNKTTETINIQPLTGYLNMYHPHIDIPQHYPKTLDLKVYTTGILTTTEKEDIINSITKQGFNIKNIIYIPVLTQTLKVFDKHTTINIQNCVQLWIGYLQSFIGTDNYKEDIEKFLKNPICMRINIDDIQGLLSTSKSSIIRNRQEIWEKSIHEMKMDKSKHSQHKHFQIHIIKWDWILCFGKGNTFDFRNMHKKIALINGKNASGKSSFVEVILLAIFGVGVPSRTNKYHSDKLINIHKPSNENASIWIEFSLDGEIYQLKRTFKKGTGKTIKPQQELVLISKQFKETKTTIINNWIKENIGVPQDFLSSVIMTQNNDMDFFSLKDNEQKELIEKILSMNDITSMTTIIKETVNIHKYVYDLLYEKQDEIRRDIDNETQRYEMSRINLESFKSIENHERSLDDIELQLLNNHKKFEEKDIPELDKIVSNKRVSLSINEDEIILDISSCIKEKDKWKYFTKYMNTNERIQQPPKFSPEHLTELISLSKYEKQQTRDDTTDIDNEDFTNVEEILSKYMEDYEVLLNEQSLLNNERPLSPKEDEISIKEAETEYEEYQSFFEKYDKEVVLLKNELNKLKEETKCQYPLNVECWACRQRPLYQTKYKMDTVLNKLQLMLPSNKIENIPSLEEYQTKQFYYENNLKNKKEYLDKQKTLITLNIDWKQRNTSLSHQITKLKADIHYLREKSEIIKRREVHQKIKEAVGWYNCVHERFDVLNANRLYEAKSYYDKYKMLLKEKTDLKREYEIMKTKATELEEYKLRIQRLNHRFDELSKISTVIKERKEFLEIVQKGFEGGLKEYMQEKVIIPYITSKINPILSHFNLELDIVHDKQQYHFIVKDNINNSAPSIERASGFQRFIVMIAMRICLSQMGICNILPQQFLIDEGFTTCDADNLNKMSEIMHYFMDYYDCILIISHLDSIRNLAHVNAKVKKEKGIAKLSFCQRE